MNRLVHDPSSHGYDVIGDVHGHADKLEALLAALGYTSTPQPDHPRQQALWSHPDRLAIFVGDLIDRGPAQIRTVDIARAMVDAGAARMVLGNHEFNAIGWATPDPELPGEHLRRRSGSDGVKNRKQHQRFLAEVGEDSDLHRELIAWFSSLPLWLELDGGLRVVHACWDEQSMEVVRPQLSADGSLTPDLIVAGNRRGSAAHAALETILKGPEIALPETHWYQDKDGHLRRNARLRWWDPHASTLRQAAEMPPDAVGHDGRPLAPLPPSRLGLSAVEPYTGSTPVLFGHYWRTRASVVCSPTAACVDFSAGKGGPLVAYRWDGGLLDAAHLNFWPPSD
ncbi:MAG TPA: metallophosphoesterase [Ilumatobacteraceae bacterium]